MKRLLTLTILVTLVAAAQDVHIRPRGPVKKPAPAPTARIIEPKTMFELKGLRAGTNLADAQKVIRERLMTQSWRHNSLRLNDCETTVERRTEKGVFHCALEATGPEDIALYFVDGELAVVHYTFPKDRFYDIREALLVKYGNPSTH